MGYDTGFLGGDPVALPSPSEHVRQQAFCDAQPIHHSRFSVIFHAHRGLAICTAHNIDGATLMSEGVIKRKDRFRFDDQVPTELQIDNDRGYRSNPWDRGHLTRRRSLHWGSEEEARRADSESYFWTNIAPQHERLHHTAWGPIENWMLERAETTDQRAAVFQGPILTPDDPVHTNASDEEPIQIPAGFWKVIVIPHHGRRTAAAFIVWQRDHDSSYPVSFSPHLEQVRLTTVEFLTGLSFLGLRALDPLRFDERQVARAADVEPGRFDRAAGVTRAAVRAHPSAILDPADIVL